MKFKIYKFNIVKSTNDIAIDLIKKKRKSFGFVFAETQTKGRGTKGKKWFSKSGNLLCSIFFPLKKNYPPFYEFTTINSVIISEVIKFFSKKKKINLKFPNDIFLNGKKVCGILQEVITSKKKNFLIIGIGINIISSPIIKNNYKATNLYLETKTKLHLGDIKDLLISKYDDFFKNLNKYKFNYYKNEAELISIN